jgi:hypothetical protein
LLGFTENGALLKLVTLCGRQLAREPLLAERLQALKVLDLAMVGLLVQEGSHAGNRRAVRHVFSEDPRVGLC